MATYDDKNPPPTTEERYGTATKASNLRVQAERSGSADSLIAAGWSKSRLGAALMRFHSEWDGCEKPRRQSHERIQLMAKTFKARADGKVEFSPGVWMAPMAAAHRQAHDWHIHEVKLLLQKLKTLPDVRRELVMWTAKQGIENPEGRVAEIIIWWLDHVCPACDGLGKDKIPGTPSLSHKDCRVCHGTGETKIPGNYDNANYQRESRQMLGYIHDCMKAASASIKSRLQGTRKPTQT